MRSFDRQTRMSVGLCLALLVLVAPGCWDYREVNQIAFVGAIGVDAAGPNVEVTWLTPIPASVAGGATAGGGGGGGAGGGGTAASVLTTSAFGPSVGDTFAKLDNVLGKAFSASHCRVVVFGEDLARRGIESVLDVFTRWYEFRRSMAVFVARPSAKEVMTLQSPLVRDPADFMVGLADSSPVLAFSGPIRIQDLIEALQSYRRDAVIPIIAPVPENEARAGAPSPGGPGGGKPPVTALRLAGLAVFGRDRMVGTLSPSETIYYLILTGRFEMSFVTFKDPLAPDHRIVIQITDVKRRIKGGSVDKPAIIVEVEAAGSLQEVGSGHDYTSDRPRRLLQRRVREELERGMLRLIHRCQTEFRTDLFAFGDAYVGKFLFWDDWRKYSWLHDKFPKAQIAVRVRFALRRPGTTFAPLHAVEGELPPLEQEVTGGRRERRPSAQ